MPFCLVDDIDKEVHPPLQTMLYGVKDESL